MILCFSRIDSRYLRAKTSKLINPSPFLLKGSCCLPALLLLLCSLECNLTSAPHPRKLLTLLSFTLQTESRRCGDTFLWGPNSVNLESRCSGLRATPCQSWAKSSWVTRGAHMFFRVCVCVCVRVYNVWAPAGGCLVCKCCSATLSRPLSVAALELLGAEWC